MSSVLGNVSLRVDIGSLKFNPNLSSIAEFIVVESLDQFLPTARIVLSDFRGQLLQRVDHLISQPIDFILGFPDKFDTQNQVKFRHTLHSISPSELLSGLDSTTTKLSLVTWDSLGPMMSKADHIRSFSKGSASNTVEELLSKLDLSTSIIEPSKDSRNYIQAQWTNLQFIRHLAHHAVSSNYNTQGFKYAFNRDQELIFASTKFLIDRKGELKERQRLVSLVYSNNPSLSLDEYEIGIVSWRVSFNNNLYVTAKGSSQLVKYYDNSDFSYREDLLSPNDRELNDSAHLLISSNERSFVRSSYMGSKQVGEPIAYKSDHLSSAMKLEVLIKWSDRINLGDPVFTIFRDNNPGEPIMESISSYWIVSKIIHYLEHKNRHYVMKLVLERRGLSKKSSVGLD